MFSCKKAKQLRTGSRRENKTGERERKRELGAKARFLRLEHRRKCGSARGDNRQARLSKLRTVMLQFSQGSSTRARVRARAQTRKRERNATKRVVSVARVLLCNIYIYTAQPEKVYESSFYTQFAYVNAVRCLTLNNGSTSMEMFAYIKLF